MEPIVASSAADVLVWIVWVLAAASCLVSAVAVVSFSNPFYSALALIGNLASLAILFLLLSAEFVAAAQVLIYAGAIVVMFLFVIAYLGGRADTPWKGGPAWQTIAAVAAASAILVEVVVVIGIQAGGELPDAAATVQTIQTRMSAADEATIVAISSGSCRTGRGCRTPPGRRPGLSSPEAQGGCPSCR